MQRNLYDDEFERLIRQKADQYKIYPSDHVWKGIHKSLHGRRRWRWAGLAIFLMGIGLYTGNWYITGKPSGQIARNLEPSISAANKSFEKSPATQNGSDNISGNSISGNSTLTSAAPNSPSANADGDIANYNLSRNSLSPLSTNSGDSRIQQDAEGFNVNQTRDAAQLVLTGNQSELNCNQSSLSDRSVVIESADKRMVIINSPVTSDNQNISIEEKVTRPVSRTDLSVVKATAPKADEKASKTETPTTSAETQSLNEFADASSESVLKENKSNGVNWLQDYAVFQLKSFKPKRLGLQLYFSPTVNYRKLSGTSSFTTSELKSIPLATTVIGDVDQFVKHKPALGFEMGANILYRNSKRVTFKAGVQFNYSRYNIDAYSTLPEIATIALNNNQAFIADTISSLSSFRNMSGFAPENLSNQYFQLSIPIGMEFRVIGSEKLSLNVAGTIQPTYLLNHNSYLITTDYKNYMREPSLIRRWNVNGGAEAFVSYNTGTVRWQVGPQFRYQLLSTYARKYPIKEQLMEYGFKIGVSKTLR